MRKYMHALVSPKLAKHGVPGQRLLSSLALLEGHHGLNAEQILHFKRAKEFGEKYMKPRALDWDVASHFPRDFFHQCGDAGFGGMGVSKDFGGSQLTRENICAITEALSSICVSTTAYVTIHNGVLAMIDKFGSADLRTKYLPSLTSMKALASFCLTEPGQRVDFRTCIPPVLKR